MTAAAHVLCSAVRPLHRDMSTLFARCLCACLSLHCVCHTGGEAWTGFGKLIEESRLVHISTLDLLCLSAFAPFWMSNDAEGREWEGR